MLMFIMVLNVARGKNNSVVAMLSNSLSPWPMGKAQRWSAKEKKHIQVDRPHLVCEYNNYMEGLDLLDSAIANYRVKIKGKKWWIPHFVNVTQTPVGAAWRFYRKLHAGTEGTSKADISELKFIRNIVGAYLPRKDNVSTNAGTNVLDTQRVAASMGQRWPDGLCR